MPNLNRVILTGRLTQDPELRTTPSDTKVCQVSLAVNRSYSDAEGERQQETTFVDAESWGRRAEVMAQYLHKADPVLIEGRLRLDRWEDKSGQSRSKLKVVIEDFKFIGSPPSGDSASNGNESARGQTPSRRSRRVTQPA